MDEHIDSNRGRVSKRVSREKTFDFLIEKTPKLKGTIKAPPSKSYTHRAIVIASMNNVNRIVNPLDSADTKATLKVWELLGAKIHRYKDHLDIIGFGGKPQQQSKELDVGESGTLLRFLLSILPYGTGTYKVIGNGTLCNRPNRTIIEALKSVDVDIQGVDIDHRLPITLKAAGSQKGGEIKVNGAITSQVVSSLLIGAPLAESDTTIYITDTLVSKPYVDITIDVLKWAGIEVENKDYKTFKIKSEQRFSPQSEFVIHGDYSSASFIIAAACLIKSDVTITDLVVDKQGDRKIIDFLNAMGASIQHTNDEVRIKGPYNLRGIDIDCADTPDLVPILAVVGCFADGKTRIKNISHVVYKESNRPISIMSELQRLGAQIDFINNNELIIQNSTLSSRNVSSVSSYDDHRVAMALSIAGLKIGRLTVNGAHCVKKSYPTFFNDMKSIGAKIKKTPLRRQKK